MLYSEVLERKAEQPVFYREHTLHRPLFWALRGSTGWRNARALEFLGVLEPKEKARYRSLEQ